MWTGQEKILGQKVNVKFFTVGPYVPLALVRQTVLKKRVLAKYIFLKYQQKTKPVPCKKSFIFNRYVLKCSRHPSAHSYYGDLPVESKFYLAPLSVINKGFLAGDRLKKKRIFHSPSRKFRREVFFGHPVLRSSHLEPQGPLYARNALFMAFSGYI